MNGAFVQLVVDPASTHNRPESSADGIEITPVILSNEKRWRGSDVSQGVRRTGKPAEAKDTLAHFPREDKIWPVVASKR